MPRPTSIATRLAPLLLVPLLLVPALLCLCALPESAAAKGVGLTAARGGVSLPGSSYRYVTLNPRVGTRIPTVVMRIEREGGRIERWWRLRGHYFLPATAYDLARHGISADGGTLVLQRFTAAYPPRRSGFAVLDTAVRLRHPERPGEDRPEHAVRRIELPGFYSLHAVSPDGRTAYLRRHLPRRHSIDSFELRELDLASGRLRPGGVGASGPMKGAPLTQVLSPSRRWAYTLFDSDAYDGEPPFLLALDTVEGKLTRLELPQLSDLLLPSRWVRED